MAATAQAHGVCPVYINAGAGLELMGYTRDGVTPTFEAFRLDVPSDRRGGEAGPPVDIQLMGEIARIRIQFTEWDRAVADKVFPRSILGTLGVPITTGTLLLNTTNAYRLVLSSTITPYNFPMALPLGAIEINKGSRFAELVTEWEAHYSDAAGYLWNRVVS